MHKGVNLVCSKKCQTQYEKSKKVIDQVQAEKNNVRFRRLWYEAKDNGRFDLHALNGEAKISDTESAQALEI